MTFRFRLAGRKGRAFVSPRPTWGEGARRAGEGGCTTDNGPKIAMRELPTGQRDYSSVRLTRHALERFVERFAAEPEHAPDELRLALARTRRLGRNPENGAIAVLTIYRDRAVVAILQDASCLTVMTWNQFVPRLSRVRPDEDAQEMGKILATFGSRPER